MKVIKHVSILIFLVFSLLGCARDLGLTPEGTFLELSLRFPDSGMSEQVRLIHSESDLLTVSLTYPDDTVISAEFTRDTSDSTLTVLVEDLEPAEGVELYVSLGLDAYDLPLSEAAQTIDIHKGPNTPALITLNAINYTISGTLTDDSGGLLKSHEIVINGDSDNPVTTDLFGEFTFTVSSEDLGEYVTFEVVNELTYEMTRTSLFLMQNRSDFALQASPEIYLDFYISSGDYSIPNADYAIYTPEYLGGEGTLVAYGSADSAGRIFYQDSNYDSADSHEILIDNDFFTKSILTNGAPGAVVSDQVLDPYVIYDGFDAYSYYNERVYRADSIGNLESFYIGDIVSEVNGIQGYNTLVDYRNGKIYIWASYDYGSYAMITMDGWDASDPTSISTVVNIGSVVSNSTYSGNLTVQQMLLLQNGNVLVASTHGSFLYDTNTDSVSTVWENPEGLSFVVNGLFQDEGGDIFALASDRAGSYPESQVIFQLNSNGTWTESAMFASNSGFALTYISDQYLDSIFDETDYIYPYGLYSWETKILTIIPQTVASSYSNGFIAIYTPSGNTWPESASPIDEESAGDSFNFLKPVGILPDNKFYFIEEVDTSNMTKKIFRLTDPDTLTLELYQAYSNGSGSYSPFLYMYQEDDPNPPLP